MQEEFKKYVQNFDLNEEKIELKYAHSLRVQKLCENIAKSEGLAEEDIQLSSVIGLLHDYGRFNQWNEYKTFNDNISIDHGDYAVKKLFDENEITKYYKNKKKYNIIYEAIKYHNKYEVEENVESRIICNIIRDADKIDILEMYKNGELKASSEGEISKKVDENFYSHKQAYNSDMNSKADILLRTLCLVYNLNFRYSFKYLNENKIIESIYNNLENKEKMSKYFEEINKYIESKTGD